jgi:cell division protein ZapA (FtsZ GTPase activity inhibitor)
MSLARPLIRQEVTVFGQTFQVATADPEALARSVELLERGYQDMAEAVRLHYGSAPATVDTRSWLLIGALNLAHRLVNLEQAASQHTQDLEHRLQQLLHDVDEPFLPSNPQLFED